MIVLAVDTSGAAASAAVLGDGVAAVAESSEPRAHARVLPALIAEAAASADVPLPDVTHVAVARGPGLFTGMRVGLVTAQMFALARGLPVAGISTLAAAARRVADRHHPATRFAVLLDARRREVFAAAFDRDGSGLDEPTALPVDGVRGSGGILESIPESAIYVEAAVALPTMSGVQLPMGGLAAEVAQLARDRWLAGLPQEPATPLYLRRPDTTAAKPQRSVLGQR